MQIYEIISRVRGNDPITLMMLKDITSSDINEKDYQTDCNILHSGPINDPFIVKCLIDKGLDIKSLNKEKQTVLFTQESPEVIKLLIERGVSVNKKDEHGNTALMSSPNNLDKIKVLLDAKANVNAKNDYNNTIAFRVKNKEVLLYLIERGLDLSIKNKAGHTPIFERAVFENPELLKCFLDYGVDINSLGNDDVLRNAVMKNITATNNRSVDSLKCLKIAKEAGLDLYHEDVYGQTIFKLTESTTQLRALAPDEGFDLNKLKKDGTCIWEDMNFKFIIKDLYLSGHLDMNKIFVAPEGKSLGDDLIKEFKTSDPEESQKLHSYKEKIMIISNLDKSSSEITTEKEMKKRL